MQLAQEQRQTVMDFEEEMRSNIAGVAHATHHAVGQ